MTTPPPGRLTPPGDTLFGRRAELDKLAATVRAGVRVVTITGTAGIGKTRLALELARRLARAPVGETLRTLTCDLSEARSEDDVVAAVARALDLPTAREAGGPAPSAAVGLALAARGRIVVLLDNFDRAASVAPSVLLDWTERAASATFLVTSRERLRIAGEWSLDLDPLGLPSSDPVGVGQTCDAVALFLDRARAACADASAFGDHLDEVAEIVRRLEGIPLAIELAAARAPVLGPRRLLELLPASLDLLSRGQRGRAAHQATMRDAVAWSWNLLGTAEKIALAECSVFRGGFTLEAAEAVLDPGEGRAVLDLVHALRDRSLLRRVGADVSGEPRFGLFESIGEFAREELSAMGRTAAALERHAAYFLSLGGKLVDGVHVHGGGERRLRLTIEEDNLLAVIHRALEPPPSSPKVERSLEALLALEPVLGARSSGAYAELLDRALSLGDELGAADEARTAPLVVRALVARTRARRNLRHFPEARADAERALSIARTLGSAALEAESLVPLGRLQIHEGRPSEALGSLERALSLMGETDRHLEATARAHAAVAWTNLGQLERALGAIEPAMALSRAAGDRPAEAMLEHRLALVHVARGDLAGATERFASAAQMFREIGDRSSEAITLGSLGAHEALRGRLGEAEEQLGKAASLSARLGSVRGEAAATGWLAGVLHLQGRLALCTKTYEQALQLLASVGDDRARPLLVAGLGSVCASLGLGDRARTLFAEAHALLERRADPRGRAVLEVHCGHLDLWLATQAAGRGDAAASAAHLDAARARLAAGARHPPLAQAGGPEEPETAEDLRLAVAVLDAALEGVEPRAGSLVIAPGAEAFRPPHGQVVSLANRRVLRRLLSAMADQRLARPGAPLSSRACIEAGWPGEALEPRTAANRLHVALTTLRKLGLTSVLTSTEGGWFLAPSTPIVRAPLRPATPPRRSS